MKKWQRFERLTAALHVLRMNGAVVVWDDEIYGYQIDVSVRFELGPYNYLHVIECKDHKDAVERKEIASFSVTIEQVKAHKGTFVSAAGFQAGARQLAEEKNIDLFTLSEIPEDWPEKVLAALPVPFLAIKGVRIRARGNQAWTAVNPARSMDFLNNARFVGRNNHVRTLNQTFQPFVPKDWKERTGIWTIHVDFTGEWALSFHQMAPLAVDAVQVDLQTFSEPVPVVVRQPPELRPSKIVYKSQRTNTLDELRTEHLPFGFDAEIHPGNYYVDVLGREYRCEETSSEEARFVLLGSPQFSKRLWAEFTFDLKDAVGRYAEISEPKEVARLQPLYEEWKTAKAEGKTRSEGFLKDLKSGAVFTSPAFWDDIRRTGELHDLWAKTVNVEFQVRLPDGEGVDLHAVAGHLHDTRRLAAKGVGNFAFVPYLNTDGSVLFLVYDMNQPTAKPLEEIAIRAAGEPVKTSTKPAFEIIVRRVYL